MKVLLSWLREYIQLEIAPEKIGEALTLAGLEVDKIETISSKEEDTLFEISLTPNLGHCMSVWGIARELAAHFKIPCKKPEIILKEDETLPIDKQIQVNVLDKANAPRYACRVIKGVKVKDSPDWIKNRLNLCGIKSINNVVDISNYVMLEFGQPLHIFDYDTIEDKKIIVASQTPYNSIVALDGVTYPIDQGMLLICDTRKPLALGGIIGGETSSVTDKTQNILIESALFAKENIRKTAKKLGIRTDAANRFEKAVDPQGISFALNRAAELILQIAGGNLAKGMIDEKSSSFSPLPIILRHKRVNQILGTNLSLSEISSYLERLEMQVNDLNSDSINVLVPTYRNDITAEIDLIEEVARVYGYNNIPKITPIYSSSLLVHSPLYLFENTVREQLRAQGLFELLTCDLISETLAALCLERGFTLDNLISVMHPSNLDQSVLRASLFPGLLQVAKHNIDHQNYNLSGFEIGKIHFKEKEFFKEHFAAGILLTGRLTPYHFESMTKEVDFYDLKGIMENILQEVTVENVHFEASFFTHFHPGRQAKIVINDCIMGIIGEVHPSLLKDFGIDQRVYYGELNLSELFFHKKKKIQLKPLAIFPSSERDWTFTLNECVPFSSVMEAINEQKSPLLEKILLLDLYKSEQIGKDRRNITLRFIYRENEKTISFETVEKEHAKIIQKVKEKIPNI